MSGCGILSDNCRGVFVEEGLIPKYTAIDLNLDDCPSSNPHLPCDKAIVAAGTRSENPIRTMIFFPGWIYGVGEGESTPLFRAVLWGEYCGTCIDASLFGRDTEIYTRLEDRLHSLRIGRARGDFGAGL